MRGVFSTPSPAKLVPSPYKQGESASGVSPRMGYSLLPTTYYLLLTTYYLLPKKTDGHPRVPISFLGYCFTNVKSSMRTSEAVCAELDLGFMTTKQMVVSAARVNS